jgi:endonuclease/exonuclease/phosphatase (EEP) superfamily protein YafD
MPHSSAPKRSPVLGVIFALVVALVWGIAIAATASPLSPVLDTIGQFAGPAVTCAFIWAAFALAGGRRRTMTVLLLGAVFLLFDLRSQWLINRQPPAGAGPAVRLYFVNIWRKNLHGGAIARSIRIDHPDVVGLAEVSTENAKLVDVALRAYPYRMEDWPTPEWAGRPRQMIASRYPLTRTGVEINDDLAVVEANVAAPHPFRLIVVHLTRPWPWHGHALQLDRLAARVQAGDADHTVLIGDLNANPASAALHRFATASGLNPAPAKAGDWPAYLPGVLRLALENVFSGKAIALRNNHPGLEDGSDHRPILVDVLPAAQ